MPPQARNHRFELLPEVYRVGETIQQAGGRPVLVGGWVRDTLLGIAHRQDFDIEVFGLPMGRLRNILARIGPVHSVGRHFGVLKLKTAAAEYDVSVPRRESNIGKGHRAFLVEPDPSMSFEDAAARRDFTINAMGYAYLEGDLLDPFGGERDLQARTLRHVGPAFGEDPLRVLRAMQFAGRFALRIDEATLAVCRAQDLAELPQERVWEEFRKLLLWAARPSLGLAWAPELGVLRTLPELQALHEAPAADGATPWALTLAMLDRAAALRSGDEAADRVLMTAALCHRMAAACGEPGPADAAPHLAAAERFLARLTREAGLVEAVLALLAVLELPAALYARREAVQAGEIRRLALRQPLPFLLRAATAHHQALHGETEFAAAAWLEAQARALGVWERAPEPILMGRHLLERGMAPGPAIGKWVRRAFERQLDGEIRSLDEALIWLAREQGAAAAAPQERPAGPGGAS
jgi:tRNA nucleotidyltransferase (CCA-adding enzyme)